MERFYTLVLILMLIGIAYGGTVKPEAVDDKAGNTADNTSSITWGALPKGEPYASNDTVDYGGLETLYIMMKTFLDVVQPNEFPYDMIIKLLGGDMASVMNDWQSLVMYGIGFGICFVIGILFVFFMPIVGCCFCCCRLCGNCGGKKIHKPGDISNCHRIAFTVLVFVFATFIMVPAACSLAANEKTTKTLNNVGTVAVNNIDDMETFMNNVILQVKHASLTNYNFTVSVLKRDLDNIGIILGERIRDEMVKKFKLDDIFQKIIALNISMHDLNGVFNLAAAQQTKFETKSDALKTKINDLRNKVVATQGVMGCSAVDTCKDYVTSTLTIDSDPDKTPWDTTDINNAASKNLTEEFEKATKEFYDIPTTVQTSTAEVRGDIIKSIDSFYSTISNAIKMIDDLTKNLGMLTDAKTTIKEYTGMIATYDKYRWYGGLGLGCLLIMIASFQYIGCLIGAGTYRPKIDPTERSCCSQTGGNFLMASVGFSFIFSSLLMLLTSLTFILGGNLQKLLCEPLLDPTYKVFKTLIDKPGGLLGGEGYFLSGMILGDNSINLTIHGILDDCKNNKSAWKAMKLNNLLDLNAATDYKSKFDIKSELNSKSNIDLSGISTSTADLSSTLKNLRDALDPDFMLMIKELTKPSVKVPLIPYATGLTAQSDKPGVKTTAADAELKLEANDITALDTSDVKPTDSARLTFKDSVTKIQTDKAKVQGDIDNVTKALEDLETYLKNSAGGLVTKEIANYVDRLLGILDSFVNKTKYAMENEVGICTPLWNLYNSIIDTLLCKSVVDTVNGFWFCLGWATMCFVPAIIFSVKLFKYLRICRPIEPDFDKKTKKAKATKKKGLNKYIRGESPRNQVAPEP